MGKWLFSSMRPFYSSVLVLLLIILVLQIWVFCDFQAGAIRIFPGNGMEDENKGRRDLFQKYFNGYGRSFSFNGTDKGFELEDGKRRIPSCPDPLHN
ncbi:CLAVATA3/ESR-RELATED 27 [Hibiscus trionum]|uniref:CLAVATA3/ESR-RELATED 27 n=1 Tax=Hibiscus trionum TaxID=183268 RepID=A0A9W7H422_HIBTR|nr:CLAVATA3/ESR-RELATED 27 [Hibiscus trionum]